MRFPEGDTQTITSWGPWLQPGQKVFGERFLLVRCLEKDLSGEVWLAKDVELGGARELKFLPEEVAADAASVARLKREAIAGRRLTHPRIVRVDEFHAEGELVAVSREHVEGNSLADILEADERQHLEVADIEAWIGDICEGLEYAHGEAKAVHRDLRPEQVLVEMSGGRAKIADFGLSRRILETRTRLTGRQNREELHYASPQSLMGDRGTVSDDLYALGAMIYHLLTGQPPFWRGEVSEEVLGKVPPRMAERRREFVAGGVYTGSGQGIDESWEQAVAACLAKKVEERPDGIGGFREMLAGKGSPAEESLRRGVSSAGRGSAGGGDSAAVGRAGKRSWARVLLALGIVGLLLAVVGGVLWRVVPGWGEREEAGTQAAAERLLEQRRQNAAEMQRLKAELVELKAEVGSTSGAQGDRNKGLIARQEEERKSLEEEMVQLAERQRKLDEAAAVAKREAERKKAPARNLAELKNRRKGEAKRLASDYLSAADGGDAKVLGRILASDVEWLGRSGKTEALDRMRNDAAVWRSRDSQMSQGSIDVNLNTDGDRATVIGWAGIETDYHGVCLVKSREQFEIEVAWTGGSNAEISSVKVKDRRVIERLFDRVEQENVIRQFIGDYYRASAWEKGGEMPDQRAFFEQRVHYHGGSNMTPDEIREKDNAIVASRRYESYSISVNPGGVIGWEGLGSELVSVITDCRVDWKAQGKPAESRSFRDAVTLVFSSEHGYQPRIRRISRM